jgi:hypothetical protein
VSDSHSVEAWPTVEVVGTKYHPSMARRGSVLVVACAVSLAAACSTTDGDGATVTTATPTPTATTTDSDPTTSTTPPTTEAPTTTLDPAQALVAQVEADFHEAFRLTDVAFQDPSDEAKVAAALEGYVGSNREFIERQLAELATAGHAAQANPDVEAAVIIEKPPVLAASPEDTAFLQACQVDSWIIVEPGAGPDGSAAIVSSDVTSYRSNFVLMKVDGRWRIRGSESLGEFPGASCPDE